MSTITVNPVGKTFDTNEGETILDAALRSGIMLKHGCRDGRCGDCRTVVEGGSHADVAYPEGLTLEDSDVSGETVLCCQAVPQKDLVLDAPEVTEFEGISIQKLVSRVKLKDQISSDVVVLKLMLAPGSEFPYLPGQYVDITLPNGVTRSYSMATKALEENAIELHIRLLPGGQATPFIFDELAARKMVTVEGPFGSFYLRETEAPMVMLASGTGFAPIKALMEQLIEKSNTRPVRLYWGGRSAEDLYMSELCEKWAAELDWFEYVPVVSDSTDGWTGRTGFVHSAVVEDFTDLSGHEVYACGAPIVIESARRDFSGTCGLIPSNFYADAFV
ncbi:MAG: FAD-binding oxidoreductase [Ketobacter sp.]